MEGTDGAVKPWKPPQEALNEFWDGLITKTPGKVFKIFPRSLYANLLPPIQPDGVAFRERAVASYQAAADECRAKVARIVRACRLTNEKFTDSDFDIEGDMDSGRRNCLYGLLAAAPDSGDSLVHAGSLGDALNKVLASKILGSTTSATIDLTVLQNTLEGGVGEPMSPESVHRVEYIFDDASFLVDGFSSSDVQQGRAGDCWWLAAIATLCSMPILMGKVCVTQDAYCGVYGFVFYRDGEWISTVVDDNLYLENPDYDIQFQSNDYDPTGDKARRYKDREQTGSKALFFSKCASPNETWLPLLEKAYAKVHGDYHSIDSGSPDEAVEDMTGGVTSRLLTNRILSMEKLWQELLNVNQEFIFALTIFGPENQRDRQGLGLGHAYSILKAVEEVGEDGKKVRLVLIRNPWGKRSPDGIGEWSGQWSDGSKEWTPYWMEKLNYRFGDDGIFWMSYNDMCRMFPKLYRTRLFGTDWSVVQQWTSVHVSWVSGYMTTKFVIEIQKAGTVVIVLSQLDTRYFVGLKGQYSFDLHFLLQEQNAAAGEHIARCGYNSGGQRSVSIELNLEPGIYEVLPQISATRDMNIISVEEVVMENVEKNPQKLRQIGLNYDIAHAKGGFDKKEVKNKKIKVGEKKVEEEKDQENKKTQEPKIDETCKGEPEGKEDDKSAESPPQAATKNPSEASPRPWNAVAVIGLRVYSKDHQLTVTLVKPKDSEEAALLDVDGISGAGATT